MSFRNSASLYMMLASTLLYFFAPLAVVVFLYTRWLLLWSLVVAIVRCYIHDDCWLCSWLVSSSVVFGRGLHNVSTSLSWLPYSADSYDLDLSVGSNKIEVQTFYYPIYAVPTACCVPWQIPVRNMKEHSREICYTSLCHISLFLGN